MVPTGGGDSELRWVAGQSGRSGGVFVHGRHYPKPMAYAMGVQCAPRHANTPNPATGGGR
jgi:hypothetical protein